MYIDDDRKYCIAIFDDDELEFAIGRGGVNINLASNVTEYRIDAFGKNEYERKNAEQEKLLADIPSMPPRAVNPLAKSGISTVSELLNSDEEKLLEIKGIAATTLEKIYDAVQSFVEKNQNETSEEEVSLESDSEENENLSEGIEAKVDDSPPPDAEPDKLEKVE